jgi:hypothetical protein
MGRFMGIASRPRLWASGECVNEQDLTNGQAVVILIAISVTAARIVAAPKYPSRSLL